MKLLRNQEGYALLIVLFVIVIFTTLGAVFMAGSLNHVKQEQVVDDSNQAVAAAEMGVNYYKTDFEIDVQEMEDTVVTETQTKLHGLKVCIEQQQDICDTQQEWDDALLQIDKEAKESYIEKIINKISSLESSITDPGGVVIGVESPVDTDSLSTARIKYKLEKIDTDPATLTVDPTLTQIGVTMYFEGFADGNVKELITKFIIYIPPSFLNPANPIVIDLEVEKISEDVTFDDVFKPQPANLQSCGELISALNSGTAQEPYQCEPDSNDTLADLLAAIKAPLDPTDVEVYTNNFNHFAGCGSNNCNGIDFEGLNIFAIPDSFDDQNNMQNLLNANLIVNGLLEYDQNIQNMGATGANQTIIVQELNAQNVMNMENTNLLVLGKKDGGGQLTVKQVSVKDNAKMCIDLDRISKADWEKLQYNISFSGTGQLIYYTTNDAYTFELKGTQTGSKPSETSTYVVEKNSYSAFLETCGVPFTEKTQISTEVPAAESIDNLFDFEVDYQ